MNGLRAACLLAHERRSWYAQHLSRASTSRTCWCSVDPGVDVAQVLIWYRGPASDWCRQSIPSGRDSCQRITAGTRLRNQVSGAAVSDFDVFVVLDRPPGRISVARQLSFGVGVRRVRGLCMAWHSSRIRWRSIDRCGADRRINHARRSGQVVSSGVGVDLHLRDSWGSSISFAKRARSRRSGSGWSPDSCSRAGTLKLQLNPHFLLTRSNGAMA